MCDRQQLLRQIQIHDFAMTDVSLYLDSHPTCQNGINYFQKHKAMREQAAAAYTAKYGPLTRGESLPGSWKWVENPWPWELEG